MSKHQPSLFFPLLLVSYEISTYLSNDMYLPALPEMMSQLNLSMHQAQLTLTFWFAGSALLPLFMGMLVDHYGRRPVLLVGGIIYILSTITCALTSHLPSLLIARFIEGGSIPSMMVAGYACIHELYDQRAAIRILALMGSVTVLAPAIGPLIGSIILLVVGWRGIFWFIAFLAAVAIFLLYRHMPETLPADQRQPIQPMIQIKQYVRILANKQYMLMIIVLGFIFTGFIVWITAGPLLIIDQFQWSPLIFGVIQMIVFMAYIIGNHQVKYLMEHMSIKQLVLTGLTLTLCGGIAAILMCVTVPTSVLSFVMAMTLYSFGSALCFAPLNRLIIEASDEPMGTRVALFTALWTGFGTLGSILASYYYNGTIASLALLIGGCIILSFLINRLVEYKV